MSEIGNWYAVQTRSNMEQCVASELQAKGIEHLFPAYEQLSQWADRKKVITRPLFPGYVLVHCSNSSQSRLRVLQTHGVVRILGTGTRLEPIPEEQVAQVQRLLSTGRQCFPHPFLRAGDRVRISRGPLKDLIGTLVRTKQHTRLVLSVELIAQSVATEVDITDVEPMSLAGQLPALGQSQAAANTPFHH